MTRDRAVRTSATAGGWSGEAAGYTRRQLLVGAGLTVAATVVGSGPPAGAASVTGTYGTPPHALRNYAKRLASADVPGASGLPVAHPAPPKITFETASGSYSAPVIRQQQNSPGRFAFYGAAVTRNAVVLGTSSPESITPKNQTSFMPWALGFVTDAPAFDIAINNQGLRYRVLVDGKIAVDITNQRSTGGSMRYIHVDWAGQRAIRSYRVEFDNGYWTYLVMGSADTLYATQKTPPRAIVMGDSYVEGTGSAARFVSWPWQLGRLMGWGDTWASGQGGTGYLKTNGTKPRYRDRFTRDVGRYNPDVIVFSGGRNDNGSFTPAQIGAEAQRLYAQARTECPKAAVYVVSNFASGSPDSTALAIRDALRAAAGAVASVVFVDALNPPIITGTGKVSARANNGNADYAIGTDGVHPTQFGHDLLAFGVAALICDAIKAA